MGTDSPPLEISAKRAELLAKTGLSPVQVKTNVFYTPLLYTSLKRKSFRKVITLVLSVQTKSLLVYSHKDPHISIYLSIYLR